MFLDLCLQNLNPQPPGLINAPIFLMGKSVISVAMFNCYVSSPEGKHDWYWHAICMTGNQLILYN